MRHNYHLEGSAFGLRPVAVEDAAFIVKMRTSVPGRVRFLHQIPADVQLQRQWLAAYLERANDYYWVVERLCPRSEEGLIGLYNLQPAERTAEWGRWVLHPASLAAAESALLVYRAAFELLNLDSVCCVTVADNLPVLSFHDSCGLRRVEALKDLFLLGDRRCDAVRHLCTREAWPAIRGKLEPQAQAIAKRFHSRQ
jgi:RimJ/RimL family protein N-acetyltransferase